MMRQTHLEHRFVKHFPEQLQSGVLYISIEYATAAHCCCCGCGEEVITPFTPTDWKMTFDGETVSLTPSIGSWNFACRSHYFIRRGQVIKAETWTDKQIEANRRQDKAAKLDYYDKMQMDTTIQPSEPLHLEKPNKPGLSLMKVWFGIARMVWRKICCKLKS
jgi:Family of unknown function (DUF6527)